MAAKLYGSARQTISHNRLNKYLAARMQDARNSLREIISNAREIGCDKFMVIGFFRRIFQLSFKGGKENIPAFLT